ncbi:MAG TPA: helical backbone metal receptor [Tepidisphaeraceae bacterium]|jgi:iron complex transport system substrate-binding protein
MGQSGRASVFCIIVTLLAAACDRPAATPARGGTIVSLSPAATDLLLAMRLGDRLVGVSAYDHDPAVAGRLPVAGDYQKIDWERLAVLRPSHLVVQGRADRLPPGLRERAAQIGCDVVNIQIDRVDDVYRAIAQLGAALHAPDAAAAASTALRGQMPAAATGQSALLVIGDDGINVVGGNNYLDDLLTAAGGINVISAQGYVRLDQEKAQTLTPDVVFVLLPRAREAVVEKAVADLRGRFAGAKGPRVIAITDADALLPASNVGRLAQKFAQGLRPTTRPAAS